MCYPASSEDTVSVQYNYRADFCNTVNFDRIRINFCDFEIVTSIKGVCKIKKTALWVNSINPYSCCSIQDPQTVTGLVCSSHIESPLIVVSSQRYDASR